MAVAVVRRDGESNEKVIGRWKKKTQKAAIVKSTRKARYFGRNESLTKQKESAIVRERYRARRKKNRFYS
jgi:ribosomal protein S21